jgi:hypothetical protein
MHEKEPKTEVKEKKLLRSVQSKSGTTEQESKARAY